MSEILEHDEAKRLERQPKLEAFLAEVMRDSAHHTDSLIFAPEYFREQLSHWVRKLEEIL
jgi:hypothetical protein